MPKTENTNEESPIEEMPREREASSYSTGMNEWQWRIQTGFHSFRGNPLLADLKHERFIQWLLFSVVATSKLTVDSISSYYRLY